MADIIKRPRYFDHQFLQVDDFREEQDYHLQMRRRHNRWLHTWGVAGGLKLEAPAGSTQVEVTSGLAVDEDGREIVLLTGRTMDLPSASGGETLFVTLHLEEQETDYTDEAGALEARRVTERPVLLFSPTAPDEPGKRLILGRVLLDADGRVASTDEGVGEERRHYAGFVGGDLEVRALWLTEEGHALGDWPSLRWGANNRADVIGSLRVSRDAGVEGALTATGDVTARAGLSVAGALSVTAATTLTGTVTTGGALQVGTDATVAGTLAVTGASTLTGTVTAKNALRVDGGASVGGRLGVGTEKPQASLHAVGARLRLDAPDGTRRVELRTDGLGVDLQGTGAALYLSTSDGKNTVLNHLGGNVGVGTEDPRTLLHVRGRMATGLAGQGAAAALTLYAPDDSAWFHIDHPGGNRLRFSHGGEPGGSEILSVLPAGSIAFPNRADPMLYLFGGPGPHPDSLPARPVLAYSPEFPTWGLMYRAVGDRMFFQAGDATVLTADLENRRVGVGTVDPAAKLQVTGGAIMPAAGSGADAGILFPQDPGGGLGDAAWIRYYARAGSENTVFEIGTANDPGDTLALITPGGVGINIREPLTSLHIPRNGLQIGTSGSYWENFHLVSNEMEQTTGLRLYNGNYGAGTHLLTVTQSGALGLGKLKPDTMFHLAPSNGFAIATLEGDASTTLRLDFIDATDGNRRHRLQMHNWRGQLSVDYTTPNGTTTNQFYVRPDGEMRVNSIRSKNGAKVGYVVDHFINAVGDAVEQGDVVVFAGSAPEHFWSTAGDIPIPEVDLAARAYDTRVCGIVAQVLTEDQLPWVEGAPDDTGLEARMDALRLADRAVLGEAGDAPRVDEGAPPRVRTKERPRETPVHPLRRFAGQADEAGGLARVGAGQMGSMVTLGAYAYCKVDADIAPIEVGDLLTTSPTPGHAQKVTDPASAAGSVLGKAMAPLARGKGRIAVLVSLQ